MIRSLILTAATIALAACSPGIALEGVKTGKSLVDVYSPPEGSCTESDLCGENYTTIVAQALAEVCRPNLGNARLLMSSARSWTHDSGTSFPTDGPTIWHYNIVRDDLKVAYIAVSETGSDCSVAFVNDVANLSEVKAYFGIETFSSADLSNLSNATVYGVLRDHEGAASFTAFSINEGKQARGVTFMTKDQYEVVEVPAGAPVIDWKQ